MSRAFVKEPDGAAPEALPPRRISKAPNYVTRSGLEALEADFERLMARRAELLARGEDQVASEELRHVDRDLAYVKARVGSAVFVDPADQPADEVAFGAAVIVREASASGVVAGSRTYTIVGEDEADAVSGKASYASPLAKALLGAKLGQTVTWRRPIGDLNLTVEGIEYCQA
jgi:transcription elongation factor GreB